MKKTLWITILIGLVLGTAWWYRGRVAYAVTNAGSAGVRIIAFGDSLTSGYGVASRDCYVKLLEERFGVPIQNAGVTGDTTTDALARLETAVLNQNPRVVIVMLGGNDLLQRQPLENAIQNLDTLISRIHEKGAAVVLVGVGTVFAGRFPAAIKTLAQKHQTACVPNVLAGIIENPNYMQSDRIHPNAAGHRIMAKRIGNEMKKRLPNVFK